jgi:hypothetical protein
MLYKKALTAGGALNYIKALEYFLGGNRMLKSPCITCDRANEDKNKCLEECEKLREYQEQILKQGIYATM